ncbi:MAG: response regulator transcription factor [Candidatus Dormibacteraeota bacterium]|nr:response regulator transcription factor [Candidatus Dormibacteraeota bacterium]
MARRKRIRVSGAVLIVEADEAYRTVLESCVRLAGCRSEAVADIEPALSRLDGQDFDVLIWGLGPEEERTSETLALFRTRTDAEVVLLADSFDSAQSAYEAGAFQVLPKPFIPAALVGALKAALRRSPSLMMHLASRVEIKGMTFDGAGRTLHFNGDEVSFTTQEWDLLAVFLSHPNRFLSAHEVIRLGWRAGAHEVEQLRTYVRRLRQKLEPLGVPCRLASQHNRGYCLIVD